MEKDNFLGVIIKRQIPDSDRSGPVKTVLGKPDCKRQILIPRRLNEMKTQIPSRPLKIVFHRGREEEGADKS